jgi:hypothetical protein
MRAACLAGRPTWIVRPPVWFGAELLTSGGQAGLELALVGPFLLYSGLPERRPSQTVTGTAAFLESLHAAARIQALAAHRLDRAPGAARPDTEFGASVAQYVEARDRSRQHGRRPQRQTRNVGRQTCCYLSFDQPLRASRLSEVTRGDASATIWRQGCS